MFKSAFHSISNESSESASPVILNLMSEPHALYLDQMFSNPISASGIMHPSNIGTILLMQLWDLNDLLEGGQNTPRNEVAEADSDDDDEMDVDIDVPKSSKGQ